RSTAPATASSARRWELAKTDRTIARAAHAACATAVTPASRPSWRKPTWRRPWLKQRVCFRREANMLPAEWRGLSRLLAVRMDNLGDVVLLGPALRSLHYALPRASITLLCSPHGAQIAPLLPWVDEVIEYRASWQELTT